MISDFERFDEAEYLEDLEYRKNMAVATLNDAINQIYNIEGDRWQMAYDTLEAVLGNLNIEVDKR
jgi:hypothetical protein